MIEIKNFLTEKTCKDCIDFFNKNYSKTKIFRKRKKLDLLNLTKINVKIKKLIDKYSKIYPGYNISNFEILKWPIGEYHDWHTDTIYYDKTTITYLNKDYKGGRTTVDNYTVEPETGKIILFDSGIRHKVSPLTEGERYVMLVWYNLIKREEL
tara:strand:- start:41 stop:499 length:459 start_codon:yes stop_codon:yes gene_type:complete